MTKADSGDLLAWVFHAQDHGAVLLDGARRVLDVNAAACALLAGGADRAALLGTTLPDPPPAGPSVRVATHARPDGDGWLVTLSDVSAAVRARRAVERIAAAVDELLFTAALGADGALAMRYVSPGIERLLGGALPPGQTVQGAWSAAIHDEDRPAVADAVRRTAEGRTIQLDYRVVGFDGRVRWVRSRTQRRVDDDGAVLFDGIVADVTAQRAGDEETARFRGVVEAADAAVALLDLDWRVRWMNPAAYRMTGLEPAAAAGMDVLELVGDEARANHLGVERPAVERDGRWAGESILLTADRRPLPVDGETYTIAHPITGAPLGLACVRRDVSDVRRLAREHEAIGSLASTIAAGVGRDDIYEAACREAARLLGADAGGIAMLSGAGPRTVGTWRTPGADDRLELAVARLGGPAAAGGPEAAAAFVGIGALELGDGQHAVGAPVMVDGRAWGLIVACRRGAAFGGEDERALARLGALVGTAVGVASARELLVRQATTDGLTGLVNHRAFHDARRAEATRSARYGRPLAVVVADLDGFKEVNDTHGHQAGDRLLIAVARALEQVVRSSEVVARLGGDEFALLLPETDVTGALATAERVRAAVAGLAPEVAFGVSMSSGVADLAQAGGNADALLRLADRALYRSKEAGRDRITAHGADDLTTE